MKSVAIITARGGSKRIPRKNIKKFNGQPIISYSIKAALESGCFDEVMVSTDDQEIAEIAIRYGAQVPFLRSETTSDDFSSTSDVLVEVLGEFFNQNKHFEYACCLYPTAPFVTALKIKESFELMIKHDSDSVIPVCKFSYPVQRALKIVSSKLIMADPTKIFTRSQDLEPMYHDVGQFYWINVARFMKSKTIFNDSVIPYEISELEVQDIDNLVDWQLAELKFNFLKQR